MSNRQFQDLSLERAILYGAAVVQVAMLAVGAVLIAQGDPSLRGLALALAGGALLLIVLVGLFLWHRYLSLPAVCEKADVADELRGLQMEIGQIRAAIDGSERARGAIRAEEEGKISTRQGEHQRKVADLEARQQATSVHQEEERAHALGDLQERHVLTGLRAVPVHDAEIAGIGPKAKQALAANGIRSAADVSAERVSAISGFGEAKTSAVVAWRFGCERALQRTMPTRLPGKVEADIRRKYEEQRALLAEEEKQETAALEADLESIRREAVERQAANDARQMRARGQLAKLEPEEPKLVALLKAYQEVTGRRFVLACLRPPGARWVSGYGLLAVVVPLVFVAGFLFQGATAVRTMSAMVVEAIPTRKPTATPTSTAVPTARPSATLVRTAQPTATAMPTEAATEVQEIPIAATATWTPGSTPTEMPKKSATPAPTPTRVPIPSYVWADEVIAYNPGAGVDGRYKDPKRLLGPADLVEKPCCKGMAQLGQGGSVLLAFTDNSIVDEAGVDFQVYGESVKDDFVLVEVSEDGKRWYSYPMVSESPGGLDLGNTPLDRAVYVRLTDLQPGTKTGAELDAVRALHSGPGSKEALPALPDAVARAGVTVYEGPSEGTQIVDLVPKGAALSLLGRSSNNAWVKVRTSTGNVGWCRAASLALNVSMAGYAVVKAPPTATPWRAPTSAPGGHTGCCKICTTGKACGDSCISKNHACHKPPGCACNG